MWPHDLIELFWQISSVVIGCLTMQRTTRHSCKNSCTCSIIAILSFILKIIVSCRLFIYVLGCDVWCVAGVFHILSTFAASTSQLSSQMPNLMVMDILMLQHLIVTLTCKPLKEAVQCYPIALGCVVVQTICASGQRREHFKKEICKGNTKKHFFLVTGLKSLCRSLSCCRMYVPDGTPSFLWSVTLELCCPCNCVWFLCWLSL
jgi:hypothetical protein